MEHIQRQQGFQHHLKSSPVSLQVAPTPIGDQRCWPLSRPQAPQCHSSSSLRSLHIALTLP